MVRSFRKASTRLNLLTTAGSCRRGEDEDGELYVLLGGSVRRFESAGDCVTGAVFSDGFESGDTSPWSARVP